MSGIRQHFIPRFLQAGFADEKQHTWVYHKDSRIFKTNIIKAGGERYFYSHQGNNEADDLITEAEKSFNSTIKSLRESNQQPRSQQIAELIAHLEVRTRNYRLSFQNAGDILFTRMFEKLRDEEFLKQMLIRNIRADPSIIKPEIEKVICQIGFPKHIERQLNNDSNGFISSVVNPVDRGASLDCENNTLFLV